MFKKASLVLGLFILAGMAIIAVFQKDIGLFLFERGANQRVGTDNTANLADGLHIALCGTGSPLPDPDRAGPCNVVIAGKQIFIVDIGEGGARNIALMGIPAGRIEGLLLTHFHSDHVDGIGPLMLMRWTGGSATTPLPVYGPKGVEEVIAGFNAAYATDNGYRIAHHGEQIVPPNGAGARAIAFEAPTAKDIVVLERGGLTVTAFKVDHDPITPAVGYRFDYMGRSLVISGDTAQSDQLNKAAKGADLLVHEALQPVLVKKMTRALENQELNNTAVITRDILNYHSSPEVAAEAAAKAGVKQLVLSHIVPPIPGRFFYPAFLGDAPDRFAGPIVVGEDGMLFSLPAESSEINQSELM